MLRRIARAIELVQDLIDVVAELRQLMRGYSTINSLKQVVVGGLKPFINVIG